MHDIPLNMAVYKTFHAQKNRIRPSMAKIGLSTGQPKILHCLVQKDCRMQKELADACDIEPATVSRILHKMEKNGLVTRVASKERKRADCVVITEKGRIAHQHWLEICQSVEDVALQGFTPQERNQFVDYLGRMYKNLTGNII